MSKSPPSTQVILRHWREAVPDDRLAHLVKDATRALVRAHPLGIRWANAARAQRAGRRHGADYVFGRKSDGAPWICQPPSTGR